MTGRGSPPAWVTALLDWFAEHRRPMPWRDSPTPYAVWISEIMLQQTQVGTVRPKFDRFIAAFPDIRRLAAADPQAVLKVWEGLGYYARARNLHRAAIHVVSTLDGRIPTTAAGLRALPGIGAYTAAAIASIAYGEAAPAVDGNVLRVIARLRGLADDIAAPATRDRIAALLVAPIRRVNPSHFNQALMELGALVCRPRNPRCDVCPLAPACVARRQGRTAELPVKSRATKGPHRVEVAGLVQRAGRVLLGQRPVKGLLGGLWEFPSAVVRADEAFPAAVVRAVRETTGVDVTVKRPVAVVDHAFSHFQTTVHAYACQRSGGRARSGAAYTTVAWVTRADLEALPLTRVGRRLTALL